MAHPAPRFVRLAALTVILAAAGVGCGATNAPTATSSQTVKQPFRPQPLTVKAVKRLFADERVTLLAMNLGLPSMQEYIGDSDLRRDIRYQGIVSMFFFESPTAARTYVTLYGEQLPAEERVVRVENLLILIPKALPLPVKRQLDASVSKLRSYH